MGLLKHCKGLFWCYWHAYYLMDFCIKDPDRSEEDKKHAREDKADLYQRILTMQEVLSGHYKIKETVSAQAYMDALDQYNEQYHKNTKWWMY